MAKTAKVTTTITNPTNGLVQKLVNKGVMAQALPNGNTAIMPASAEGTTLFLDSIPENDEIVLSLSEITTVRNTNGIIIGIVKDEDDTVDDTWFFPAEDVEEICSQDAEAIVSLTDMMYMYHSEVKNEKNLIRVIKILMQIESLNSIFNELSLMTREQLKSLFSAEDEAVIIKIYNDLTIRR